MDSDSPRSLKSLFATAEKKRLELEQRYDAQSESYAETLSAAINDYKECLKLISVLSIFSSNEGLEDISTSDLPYLLVDFYLAELIQKTSMTSPHDRIRTLDSARNSYERFLHILDSYGLLGPKYKKWLEQYQESPAAFSTIPSDPSARRDAKISNFKAEKELRTKLEYLRKRPEYADFEADGTGDEEVVRAVYLANLDFSAHSVFQSLESMNREAEVLGQAPEPLYPSNSTVADDERRRREGLGDEYSERLDRAPLRRLQSAVGGPLLTKEGKPLQPFTLLGTRQDLAKGVFRPGHNLPTMSIDEYLEEERRRGGIIEGGGEASGRIPEPDEDDMEKADAETMKARAWDEFTEANPKGSGNTLNRG